ncbi:MAG: hypothetical protein H6629_05320 [Calditrichae bacterium]|nr:hypothetical protein [Calditrichia bacterium]
MTYIFDTFPAFAAVWLIINGALGSQRANQKQAAHQEEGVNFTAMAQKG